MARRNARKMWTDHLAGRGSKPKAVNLRAFVEKKPFDGLVMGIDPSLRGSGLAVLEFSSGKPTLKASRTVKFKPKVPFDVCLGRIHQAVVSFLGVTYSRFAATQSCQPAVDEFSLLP